MDHFLKVLVEFVIVLLLYYVLFFFGHEAYEILASWPGVEPATSALRDEILTTGPPWKYLHFGKQGGGHRDRRDMITESYHKACKMKNGSAKKIR